MTTILLVRHGENEWVRKHRLAGWIEGVHLNENGKKQATQAAARLAHLPLAAVYSSPVERCMETAAYIAKAHELEIKELPMMGEVRYGKWEGKKIRKLAKKPLWQVVQFFPSRMQFPKGETMRGVQARAVDSLEALSQQHQNEMIVVCSHADVIKLTLAYYLGVHIDLFQRVVISPASVSVIQLPENGRVRVLRINDDGPLTAPAPKPQKAEKNGKESK